MYSSMISRIAAARLYSVLPTRTLIRFSLSQYLFVSASRHESYGLTIAEAEAAGCRIVSHRHYGASGTVVDCEQPQALAKVLTEMVGAGRTAKRSVAQAPSDAAARLTELLLSPTTNGL